MTILGEGQAARDRPMAQRNIPGTHRVAMLELHISGNVSTYGHISMLPVTVSHMPDKVKVSYYVPPPVARAIRLIAAREERSQSDVAADALTAYLETRQEHLAWLRVAEPAFDFWDNEVDAAYDAL